MNVYARYVLLFTVTAITAALVFYAYERLQPPAVVTEHYANDSTIMLPKPKLDSNTSIEEALLERESIRSYKNEPLTLDELSQLLWSAQGVTREWGGRTTPSAGATYPLETYVIVGNVRGLKPGLYRYLPGEHAIELVYYGDVKGNLSACAGQRWVGDCAFDIVFAADYERTTRIYGDRGLRYVHMEAGHAAQNVYLQCVSTGCGTVVVGAFDDTCVKRLLELPGGQEPLYIMPVGRT